MIENEKMERRVLYYSIPPRDRIGAKERALGSAGEDVALARALFAKAERKAALGLLSDSDRKDALCALKAAEEAALEVRIERFDACRIYLECLEGLTLTLEVGH